MTLRLEGKVALVAGGTRGAGRGIAVELGAAGATVYVAGRPSAAISTPRPTFRWMPPYRVLHYHRRRRNERRSSMNDESLAMIERHFSCFLASF